MITIEIENAEQVARSHAGAFKTNLGKTLRVDFKQRIEQEMAARFKQELIEQGIEVSVKVTATVAEY